MKTTTAADISYACGCLTPYGQSITSTTQGPCVNPEKHGQRGSIAWEIANVPYMGPTEGGEDVR